MCYSKKLSLISFLFGVIASFSLGYFGKKESYQTNKMIALFFLFVSLMQLVEYFLWSDVNCSNGLNKFGAILGPILNHLQPIIMLVFATYYLKSTNVISNSSLVHINTIYLVYVLYKYYIYISNKDNLCIKTNKCNHLDWTWKKDFNYIFYFVISFINVANFYNNTN